MRLSEAIRLGSMLKPQAFGKSYDAHIGGTCAIAAAVDAIGLLKTDGGTLLNACHLSAVPEAWRLTINQRVTCPNCHVTCRVDGVAAHLNDHHRWTREQIAAWVETLETESAPALVGDPALAVIEE